MSADVLHSLGVDYLTLVGDESRMPGQLHSLASQMYHTERVMGNRHRAFGMSGFKGFQCGGVQIGVREELVMVRLSSDAAARGWSTLGPLASNCTRIDLQATIFPADGPAKRLAKNRRAALRNSQEHNDSRIVRWVQDNRGGHTLYLGARQSEAFGRVYDKFAESNLDHYRNTLRYEVEFKGKLAHFILRCLLQEGSARFGMTSYISQFFERRGVQLEISPANPATYCCSRNRSDADKSLQWLRDAVRPSVIRLINLGRGEEVLEALGLVVQHESTTTIPDQTELVH